MNSKRRLRIPAFAAPGKAGRLPVVKTAKLGDRDDHAQTSAWSERGGRCRCRRAPSSGQSPATKPRTQPARAVGYAAVRASPTTIRDPAANLIVWNNIPYVIDTGYGVTFKLVEKKFPLPALRYTFITHHHSDHNAEFGLLLYNA